LTDCTLIIAYYTDKTGMTHLKVMPEMYFLACLSNWPVNNYNGTHKFIEWTSNRQ